MSARPETSTPHQQQDGVTINLGRPLRDHLVSNAVHRRCSQGHETAEAPSEEWERFLEPLGLIH